MPFRRLWVALLFAAFAAVPAGASALESPSGSLYFARLDGVIGPGTANYLTSSLRRAEEADGAAYILVLNTPGGLEASMRTMVQAILGSRIPVVVYVAPPGARAASAGAFITLAANVAAMAPGTNIGAAHPVNLMPGGGGGGGGGADDEDPGGGPGRATKDTSAAPSKPARREMDTMSEKVANDAAAFIRSIATRRGRNVDWAERAVRESISSSADEALAQDVIDFIAPTEDALVDSLEGRTVMMADGPRVLQLRDHPRRELPMGFREKVMALLSDPNAAYIFLMLGFYGILFELSNPGAILPGIVGGIFMILAFFALQTIPVNYAGLLLILFAMVLFIAELKVVSHGLLAAGGVVSLLLGSILLFNSPAPYWRLSLSVLVPVVLVTAGAIVVALVVALRTMRRRVTTGKEGMVGLQGRTLERIAPGEPGRVRVHGEIWKAESASAIEPGAVVEVVEPPTELCLKVKPVPVPS